MICVERQKKNITTPHLLTFIGIELIFTKEFFILIGDTERLRGKVVDIPIDTSKLLEKATEFFLPCNYASSRKMVHFLIVFAYYIF